MFVQVIKAKTDDAEGVRRQMDRWKSDLRPGATGYLGTTAGITDDGTVVALARFESREAAEANSRRPEQTAWWNELEKYFSGTPTFLDSTDVSILHDGGSDRAGFVQIMEGRSPDAKRLRELETVAEPMLREHRPELLGGITVWDGDHYVEVAYFTTEDEARSAERQEPPPDVAAVVGEFMSLMGDVTYYDLHQPMLV